MKDEMAGHDNVKMIPSPFPTRERGGCRPGANGDDVYRVGRKRHRAKSTTPTAKTA
jgi:hypothetical protein